MHAIAEHTARTHLHALSRPALAVLFLLFCYALLTWRATLLTDTAPLVSERRILAVLVGAGVFWLALEQLKGRDRLTLAHAGSWIVAGTILVLLTRLAAEQLVPAAPASFEYDLRWSLAWGGYFGMWLMGALAFRRDQAGQRAAPAVHLTSEQTGQLPDTADWLAEALIATSVECAPYSRDELAERIMEIAGQYELADHADPLAARHNARVVMAQKVAARLRTG